jgi:hypothetical protein
VRREGVVELLLQNGVQLVDRAPGLLQLEAGAQHLDAQVILLVDHHGNRLVAADDDAGAGLRAAEFAADEVALDEDLALEFAEVRDADEQPALHLRRAGDGVAADLDDAARSSLSAQPGKERPARLRARRTRVMRTIAHLLTGAIGQLGRRIDERRDIHGLNAAVAGRKPP